MDYYLNLLNEFISGNILASDFERKFLNFFKNDKHIPENTFEILNQLFIDIDAFCDDPSIANYDKSDPFHDITKEELLERSKVALDRLKSL